MGVWGVGGYPELFWLERCAWCVLRGGALGCVALRGELACSVSTGVVRGDADAGRRTGLPTEEVGGYRGFATAAVAVAAC